jgi:hypothetical protein
MCYLCFASVLQSERVFFDCAVNSGSARRHYEADLVLGAPLPMGGLELMLSQGKCNVIFYVSL